MQPFGSGQLAPAFRDRIPLTWRSAQLRLNASLRFLPRLVRVTTIVIAGARIVERASGQRRARLLYDVRGHCSGGTISSHFTMTVASAAVRMRNVISSERFISG